MKISKLVLSIILVLFSYNAFSQQNPLRIADSGKIDIDGAESFFNDFYHICQKDAGNLWGINLYGRIMFVDQATGFLVANHQNLDSTFINYGNVFIGVLDSNYAVANTSKNIYGEIWTMVNWDFLPLDNYYERNWIIAHESFHRIQNKLGLPFQHPENSHLETIEGRIFLQLEWRALQKALNSSGYERLIAIKDALVFRNYRYSIFDSAKEEEAIFEMHEGMAEYTGACLSGYDKDTLGLVLSKRLADAENAKSYSWYFAYKSAPAYSYLLDSVFPNWKNNISSKINIADTLQKYLGIELPDDLKEYVDSRISLYQGEEIIKIEKRNQSDKLLLEKRLHDLFFNETTLSIPLTDKMRISFDPMNSFDLGDKGTVYNGFSQINDSWGVLRVETKILLDKNWEFLKLTKPLDYDSPNVLRGDGWQLFLNKDWEISSAGKNYKITLANVDAITIPPSKTIVITAPFASNYLWHLLVLSRISYVNTEYEVMYKNTIDSGDIRFLNQHASYLEFGEGKSGVFTWPIIFLPSYLELKNKNEFIKYYKILEDAFISRNFNTIVTQYPFVKWDDPFIKMSSQLFFLSDDQLNEIDEEIEKLLPVLKKLVKIVIDNISAYESQVWPYVRNEMEPRLVELQDFFKHNDIIKAWEEVMNINFKEDRYYIMLNFASKNGPDANSLSYDKNIFFYNYSFERTTELISHEVGTHIIFPDFINYSDTCGFEANKLYAAYEVLLMWYNKKVLNRNNLSYELKQFNDNELLRAFDTIYTAGMSPLDMLRKVLSKECNSNQ